MTKEQLQLFRKLSMAHRAHEEAVERLAAARREAGAMLRSFRRDARLPFAAVADASNRSIHRCHDMERGVNLNPDDFEDYLKAVNLKLVIRHLNIRYSAYL